MVVVRLMHCVVKIPPVWVDTIRLDDILLEGRNPHSVHYRSVEFVFSESCAFRIDATLRLLSLVNQICCEGVRVTLVFEGNLENAMKYLTTIGFFEYLDPVVEVLPIRPARGLTNSAELKNEVSEIFRIGSSGVEQEAVPRLIDRFLEGVLRDDLRKTLWSSLFAVLGEYISNIQRHASILRLDGYVALQRCSKGNEHYCIAASDSSFGLIETLRPTLKSQYPTLEHLEDSALIKLMFTKGLSRFGDECGGTGLATCRRIAAKFQANIEARQNFSRFRIDNAHRRNITVKSVEMLPYIWGTHISLNFIIDE